MEYPPRQSGLTVTADGRRARYYCQPGPPPPRLATHIPPATGPRGTLRGSAATYARSNKPHRWSMQDMTGTQHEGSTIQRLDRLEAKVDDLTDKVATLTTGEAVRRTEDREIPARIRRLEDAHLVWDTRWSTIGTMLTRVFGMSILAAAASILSIMLAISQLSH